MSIKATGLACFPSNMTSRRTCREKDVWINAAFFNNPFWQGDVFGAVEAERYLKHLQRFDESSCWRKTIEGRCQTKPLTTHVPLRLIYCILALILKPKSPINRRSIL